jgi:DNA-binding transcriptional LysR family regulator
LSLDSEAFIVQHQAEVARLDICDRLAWIALLRAFVGIVECGRISAGARRLKIPQPTLSRYLCALEEQCDAALLRRDIHHMSMTQQGERLLADARTILAHAEEADQRLHEDQTTPAIDFCRSACAPLSTLLSSVFGLQHQPFQISEESMEFRPAVSIR